MSASDLYRILIPVEYHTLRDAVPKSKHRTLIDTMLNTGMRYEELRGFADNLPWFDAKNRCINLPAAFTKTGDKRTVHLTPAFSKQLSQHLREFKTLDFPKRAVMNENLKRWWLLTTKQMHPISGLVQGMSESDLSWYPTVKTFRKTWESYLLASGYDYMAICCNQGHSPQISYSYYTNLDPLLKSCMDEVKKLTDGWMT